MKTIATRARSFASHRTTDISRAHAQTQTHTHTYFAIKLALIACVIYEHSTFPHIHICYTYRCVDAPPTFCTGTPGTRLRVHACARKHTRRTSSRIHYAWKCRAPSSYGTCMPHCVLGAVSQYYVSALLIYERIRRFCDFGG